MEGPPTTGLGRRRGRLSTGETQRRMLRAALEMVHRTGLTVSLEHLSFEDVIRDAGVSRSAAYRRWPYKDLFFSDLVKEIARAATPAAVAGGTAMPVVWQVVRQRAGWLETPNGRRALGAELLRQASLRDFETIVGSTEWRTYLALHATYLSLGDSALRSEVQAALAEAERGFLAGISASYESIAGLIGYRLRPECHATFDTLAALVSATMRGLVVMALADPDLATRRIPAAPFGFAGPDATTDPTAQALEWSLPALGVASIAFTLLEPDPAIEWDADRIEAVRRAVEPGDPAR